MGAEAPGRATLRLLGAQRLGRVLLQRSTEPDRFVYRILLRGTRACGGADVRPDLRMGSWRLERLRGSVRERGANADGAVP